MSGERLNKNELFSHSWCFINWQLFISLLTSITVFCYWQLISFIWWKMRYSSTRWLEKEKHSQFERNCLWIGYLVFFLPQNVNLITRDMGSTSHERMSWKSACKKGRHLLQQNYLRGYGCLVSSSLNGSNPLTCRLFILCSKVLFFFQMADFV